MLSQSFESRENRDLALNSLVVALKIEQVSNLLPVVKIDAAHAHAPIW